MGNPTISVKKKLNKNKTSGPVYMRGSNPTEPANYMDYSTAEYRVIIAGILLKGMTN
jgi:hypothetical protein